MTRRLMPMLLVLVLALGCTASAPQRFGAGPSPMWIQWHGPRFGSWCLWPVASTIAVAFVLVAFSRRRSQGRVQHAVDPAPRARWLRSRVLWAVLLCLIGLGASYFAPWIDVFARGSGPKDLTAAETGWEYDGVSPPWNSRPPVRGAFHIDGGQTWEGATVAVLCLFLSVFLVAMSFVSHARVWRPVTILSVAVIILAVTLIFLASVYAESGPVNRRLSQAYPRMTLTGVATVPTSGPHLVTAVALGLLVLGAVELDRVLRAAGAPRPLTEPAGRISP
jgi:hypothetical protein